jgi:brefeldin A-inhibited guanine nucleotide-exchange protein
LEKEELLNYQFQREFLKPFQDLMSAAATTEVKDLIIVCLTHMVQSRARSIRSGWSTLFATLSLAAADPLHAIAAAGYALASRTVADHFAVIGDHHTLGVECVAAYLRQHSHTDIALSAARCLADYAKLLHDLAADVPAPEAAAADASLPPSVVVQSSLSISADPERLWWPLCEVLAQAIGTDPRPTVRAVALSAFFGVLEAELAPGGVLHGPLGLKAFRELALPIFDAVQPEPGGAASPGLAAWIEGTGLPALTAIERAFCRSSELLAPLLDDVIALFVRCLQQPHHARLSQAAAASLLHVVRQTGASFSQETWALVCAQLQSCFDASAAEAYAAPAPAGGAGGAGGATAASPLLREVSAKVEAEAPEGSGPYELQVLLLSTVYQLLQSMYPSMTLADVEGLLNCMLAMYDKAAGVIATAMGGAASGVAEGGDGGAAGPSAIELEEASHLKHEAMSYYLQVLFLLYAKLGPAAKPPAKGGPSPPLGSGEHVQLIAAAAEYRLVSFCLLGLRDYLSTQERVAAGAGGPGGEETLRLAEGTLAELTSNIVMLLRGVLAFPEPHFSKHLPAFYPLFADLIHCESKQIAAVLRELFAQRIAPHLQQASG